MVASAYTQKRRVLRLSPILCRHVLASTINGAHYRVSYLLVPDLVFPNLGAETAKSKALHHLIF